MSQEKKSAQTGAAPVGEYPAMPEPAFRLKWRDGEYRVSKPNIGDTDCYTPEQIRAALAATPPEAPKPSPDLVKLMQSAIEGECDGLSVDAETATTLIRYAHGWRQVESCCGRRECGGECGNDGATVWRLAFAATPPEAAPAPAAPSEAEIAELRLGLGQIAAECFRAADLVKVTCCSRIDAILARFGHAPAQEPAGLREAFEEHMSQLIGKGFTARTASGFYQWDEVNFHWKTWNAALAATPVREAEPDALADMEQRKDAAYLERNQVVAALASAYPSGVARTAIEGWSEDWHGCVYIDLPTGQASWHFHDSQAYLFAHLPPYPATWDGHTTEEKYRRLAALSAAPKASEQAAPPSPEVEGLREEASNLLAGLIDIYDDEQKNAPEERCYVPDAWNEVLSQSRNIVARIDAARKGMQGGEHA